MRTFTFQLLDHSTEAGADLRKANLKCFLFLFNKPLKTFLRLKHLVRVAEYEIVYLTCFVRLHRILYRAIEEVDPPPPPWTVKKLFYHHSNPARSFHSDDCILELEARPEMTCHLTKFVKATSNCIGSSMVCI